MSEMYTPENTNKALTKKAHQNRACAVCGEPVVDEKAELLPIGGGLELKVHRTCMNELADAMQPVAVTIPVPATKPIKKSTVAKPYVPFDKVRLKELIRFEFAKLLMQHGLIQ